MKFGCGVILFLLMSVTVARAANYDALIDEMVSLAKLAAQAHNAGNTADATAFGEKVASRFKEATKLDAQHPQAYVTYATFLSNSNRFELALDMFRSASALIGGDARARAQIMAQQRRAEYGLYSMKRDAAYRQGTGDVYEAAEWGEKQLTVTPEPSRTNHDVATLYAMLCEYDTKACETASTKFRISTHGAHQQFATMMSHERYSRDRTLQLKCSHSHIYMGSWGKHRQVEVARLWGDAYSAEHPTPPVFGYAYLNTITVPARIIGRDGLVQLEEPGDCTIFSPASDYYLNVADNLASARQDLRGAPTHETPIFSLVQFSAASYYHWIAEAIPRLVLFMAHFKKVHGSGKVRIIIPRLTPASRFIVASIDLVMHQQPDSYDLVEYVPGTLVQQNLSYVSWDKQPCPASGRSGDSGAQRECPALAHPHALARTRAALRTAIRQGSWGAVRNVGGARLVVFARRGDDVTMRRGDEAAAIDRIRQMLRAEATVLGPTELQIFDSGANTLEQGLSLFKRASVVVGIHGGALANIIACAPGTALVEIGFVTDAATHYQHMALSLGMIYRRVRVTPDSRGRAMGAPEVTFNPDTVAEAVKYSLGDWAGGRDPSPSVIFTARPTPYPWDIDLASALAESSFEDEL